MEDEFWEALGWRGVEETLGCDVIDIVLKIVCWEALGGGDVEEPLGREVTDTVGEPELVAEDDVCELPGMPAPVLNFPKPPGPNLMPSQHPSVPVEQQKV